MGAHRPSIISGGPLDAEPLMGAQTIGGYLRDVAARHGSAEALVLHSGGQRISWSYDELLAQANARHFLLGAVRGSCLSSRSRTQLAQALLFFHEV